MLSAFWSNVLAGTLAMVDLSGPFGPTAWKALLGHGVTPPLHRRRRGRPARSSRAAGRRPGSAAPRAGSAPAADARTPRRWARDGRRGQGHTRPAPSGPERTSPAAGWPLPSARTRRRRRSGPRCPSAVASGREARSIAPHTAPTIRGRARRPVCGDPGHRLRGGPGLVRATPRLAAVVLPERHRGRVGARRAPVRL